MPLEPDFSPAGLRVFIVEDEFQVLLLLEDMLAELGCFVVGVSSTVSSALDKAQTCEADAAILDVNLAGQKVYPVAERLRHRGTPIIFSTGYGLAGLEQMLAFLPRTAEALSAGAACRRARREPEFARAVVIVALTSASKPRIIVRTRP